MYAESMELFSLIISLAAELAKLARTLVADGMRFIALLGIQGAADQTCIAPGLLAYVLLAGEATFKAQLHRPQARTGASVAGLPFLSRSLAIAPQAPI